MHTYTYVAYRDTAQTLKALKTYSRADQFFCFCCFGHYPSSTVDDFRYAVDHVPLGRRNSHQPVSELTFHAIWYMYTPKIHYQPSQPPSTTCSFRSARCASRVLIPIKFYGANRKFLYRFVASLRVAMRCDETTQTDASKYILYVCTDTKRRHECCAVLITDHRSQDHRVKKRGVAALQCACTCTCTCRMCICILASEEGWWMSFDEMMYNE